MKLTIVTMNEDNCKTAAKIAADNLKEAWSEDTYRSQLANPNDHTFIAYCGGEPAGFLSVWYVLDEIEINNIAVYPKFRRQGIAESLFAAMREALPHAERTVLEVRSSNKAAIALYQKLGFAPVGVRKNFYKDPVEDAVIFVLDNEQKK